MSLSVEDLLRFLGRYRDQRYKCAYCGNDSASILVEDEEKKNQGTAEFRFVPWGCEGEHDFYGLCCTKCGNTSFFAAAVVRAWLQKEPPPPKDK